MIKNLLIMLILTTFIPNAYAVSTKRAVLHHTASPEWTKVADIDQWHKGRGWTEIGYHYVILANGDIKEGRSILKNGAHKRGSNHLVGVALVGYNEFSKLQKESLVKLLKRLKTKELEKHHEKCPGDGINLNNILKEIQK